FSLNASPMAVSRGNGAWHNAQEVLYFLANAGIAFALPGKNVRKRIDKTTKKMLPNNIRLNFTSFPRVMMKMTPDQKINFIAGWNTKVSSHLYGDIVS
ncbi:MAG: hypothetical protein WBZ05_09085, partial [Desulfobacterales bacterium]